MKFPSAARKTPDPEYWFPGRLAAGVSLVVAPVLVFAGVLLRARYEFFYPHQLAAFAEAPALMTAAYSCFSLGTVLLFPGVLAVATRIGRTHPKLAAWGGLFVLIGLCTRTFHAGIDHLAFQLVDVQGLPAATKAVTDSYGAWDAFRTPVLCVVFGWYLLAFGAYRSGTLGLVRSLALAATSAFMVGTLKGTDWTSVVAATGLCAAFVPLGVRILREGERPSRRSLAVAVPVAAAIVFLYFFAPTG